MSYREELDAIFEAIKNFREELNTLKKRIEILEEEKISAIILE